MVGEIEMQAHIFANNVIQIVIRDDGVGIQDVDKARQPFYTTADEQERSGMGFTMMETFMDEVEVVSRYGEGTTVTMRKRLGVTEEVGR